MTEGASPILRERGLVATMPDGTRLVADAWYPAEGGPFPVLLQRLPYGRTVASSPVLPSPAALARRGLAVVVQDVRGRGDSGGEFEPFCHEATDGAATVEWAAELPFCDGRVITYGFSYQGTCQLGAAALRPRGLVAVAPMMCATEPYEMLYEGGCLLWEATATWAAQLATGRDDDEHTTPSLEARPLASAVVTAPRWYDDWVGHEHRDAYWAALAPDLDAIDVPVFTIAGYADTFAAPTARLAARLRATGVFGPWAHMPWGTRLGDLELPDASPRVAHDAFCDFVDSVIAGDRPVGVRYYVVGAGWRDAPRFGADDVVDLVATSVEGASSRHGDGVLAAGTAATELCDTIVSEPLVPHPYGPSPFPDRASAEDRRDVLCYTSAPLDAALEIVGSGRVRVVVSSEAPSVDVVAALCVVSASGASRSIAVGAARASVSSTAELEVELGPVAWRVEPGSRLRLDISASAYPRYAANPQAEGPPAAARRAAHRVAELTLRRASVSIPVGR